jgi:hypothetical protein
VWLDDRTLPSTVTWIHPAGGAWDTAANWSDGRVNRVNEVDPNSVRDEPFAYARTGEQ